MPNLGNPTGHYRPVPRSTDRHERSSANRLVLTFLLMLGDLRDAGQIPQPMVPDRDSTVLGPRGVLDEIPSPVLRPLRGRLAVELPEVRGVVERVHRPACGADQRLQRLGQVED